MPRSYANMQTSIWNVDSDFRKRGAAAQRLYFLLATQPGISACGVLPLTVTRWARMAPDTTEEDVMEALAELAEHRYVVVDHDTEEVLIRTFTRHDGGYTNSRRLPAIRDATDEIVSPLLLAALRDEFERLSMPDQWRGRAKPQVDSLSDSLWHSPSDGLSDSLSPNERVVVTDVRTEDPQPTTRNPKAPPPLRGAPPAENGGWRFRHSGM